MPLSCPNCDAPARDRAVACPRCGYRFLDDEWLAPHRRPRGPRRPSGRLLGVAGAALAALTLLAVVLTRGGEGNADRALPSPAPPEPLAERPLSAGQAERRLEAMYTSVGDDDSAAARCSARRPKPAYSVRDCVIRYPSGVERSVRLITNARGRELLERR